MVDKCRCECKKRRIYEKNYIWNPATCNHENGNYLASIMDDSAIICNEVIDVDAKLSLKDNEETKLFQQILMKRK